MKKKLSLEENQIVNLIHRGSRNFQNECKLLDDKKFVLKHMKESYLCLSKISKRLQRDKDVIDYLSIRKILNLDMQLFNSDEKNEIYQWFIQKIDTDDIFLLARYKSFFF